MNLLKYLSDFVVEDRLHTLEKVLANRTRYATVVLEDIFQSQNASAVLRSCDCFGIQDVHIIENTNRFEVNPDVTQGSAKWLNLYKYSNEAHNTESALLSLKEKNYRIVATSPHAKLNLADFELEKGKTAFVFGTELTGVSPTVIEQADEVVKIPMYGFTESFNISVSAALVLNELRNQLEQKTAIEWQLTEEEREEILTKWLTKTLKNGPQVVAEYLKRG